MATEAVIERMIVELIGDSRSYKRMIQDAREMTAAYATKIGSLWRNAAGQMITSQKKMQAEMLVSQHAMMRYAGNMKILGQEVARAGRSLSLYLTLPLQLLGYAAIKAGSDFESGFTGIQKTVNASVSEFAVLNKEFRELIANVPLTATELLKIGEIGGQLGIKADKLTDFTRVVAELSVSAQDMTVDDAATSMARFANIVQMGQDDFRNLASAVVVLGNNMAATEHEIMEMGMRIAGAGHSVGLTAGEVLALAASLTSVGIKSEMGGSAISRMMMQVTRDVALGADTVETFAQVSGMSTEKFKESWRRNVGETLLMFLSGLEALDSEAKIVALKELELDGIRLHQTMLNSSNAVGMFAEAVDLGNTALEEGTGLAKEADRRFATFASTVTLLRNNFSLFLTELFEVARPTLISIVDALESLTESMRGWSDETKGAMIVVGAVVAALGPFLLISGSLIASVGQLRLAFLFLRPALLAVFGLPVIGQILAIISLLVLVFGSWGKEMQHLGTVSQAFGDLWSSVKDLFEELMVVLEPLVKTLGEALVVAADVLVISLTAVVYVVKELAEWLTVVARVFKGLVEDSAGVKFELPTMPKTPEEQDAIKGAKAAGIDIRSSRSVAEWKAANEMKEASAAKALTTAKAPKVTPVFETPIGGEGEWGKEFNKAFDRVEDMKARFDDELSQMRLSERDYLISQLDQEADKGVYQKELHAVLDAYDKLQEVKKQAAAAEKETMMQETIQGEIDALRDQRTELELGARAFLAYDLARQGASKAQIMAALKIYDQVEALEELADKEKDAKKEAEDAAKAQQKFRDSIERTVEATGSGRSALIAREEARGRRPDQAKKVENEKEKEKAEKQKQAMLAEKGFEQGKKMYEALKKIEENTAQSASKAGTIIQPANIGT